MAKYLAAVHTHAVVATCQTFPFSFKPQLNYTCAAEAIRIPQCVFCQFGNVIELFWRTAKSKHFYAFVFDNIRISCFVVRLLVVFNVRSFCRWIGSSVLWPLKIRGLFKKFLHIFIYYIPKYIPCKFRIRGTNKGDLILSYCINRLHSDTCVPIHSK